MTQVHVNTCKYIIIIILNEQLLSNDSATCAWFGVSLVYQTRKGVVLCYVQGSHIVIHMTTQMRLFTNVVGNSTNIITEVLLQGSEIQQLIKLILASFLH